MAIIPLKSVVILILTYIYILNCIWYRDMVEFNLHFYRIWENIYFSKCVHCGQSEHTHNNKKKEKEGKKYTWFHSIL